VFLYACNISTGIAAGMIGFNPALTTGATFLFNFLTLYGGERIGHYSSARIIKGISGMTAGLLLSLIGLYEMFG
jgi:putative Mn2+ efflux pump MntP